MKLTSVLITAVVAIILQVTLSRYTVGGRVVFDLVLVGVVFAALQWGPAAGMLAGTIGGLFQDVLANEIVGVGGLSKTLVGCLSGIVGTQFVLAASHARMLVMAVATIAHRLLILALHGLIDQQWPGVPWGAMLAETGINAITAFLAFHATSTLPGAVSRQRMNRRSSLSRRQW